jgi:hypothetical protein
MIDGLLLGDTLGTIEGLILGYVLGTTEGLILGISLGNPLGIIEGLSDDEIDGVRLGIVVGFSEGEVIVNSAVGWNEGSMEGLSKYSWVGVNVGKTDGLSDDSWVGWKLGSDACTSTLNSLLIWWCILITVEESCKVKDCSSGWISLSLTAFNNENTK